MTDIEYDVIDELYFVQPYSHLKDELDLEDNILLEVLEKLLFRGFVKCFRNQDDELPMEEVDLKSNFRHYYYLATKKGLMAHNAGD